MAGLVTSFLWGTFLDHEWYEKGCMRIESDAGEAVKCDEVFAMNRQLLWVMAVGVLVWLSAVANAEMTKALRFPAKGVVCDAYVCADAQGLSTPLTAHYLGKKQSRQLDALGEFDRSSFTFANGVYCDTKEKVCRKDRYYGANGRASGDVDEVTSRHLFAVKSE
jgi:Fels-1 Prophage Protein-like.